MSNTTQETLQGETNIICIEIRQLGGEYKNKITVKVPNEGIRQLLEEFRGIQNSNLTPDEEIESELELLRNKGILPFTATLDNLKISAMNIKDAFIDNGYSKKL